MLDGFHHFGLDGAILDVMLRYRSIYIPVVNTHVDRARNKIVRRGFEQFRKEYGEEPDWFLFLDDDMEIRLHLQNVCERLMAHDRDIVGSFYCTKKHRTPVFGWWDGGVRMWEPHTLLEVDFVGFGCTAIKAEVFKGMQDEPWEDIFPPASSGKTPKPPHNWFDSTKIDGMELRADLYFCRRAQEYGYKVWVDTSIFLGHAGAVVYPEAHMLPSQQIGEQEDAKEVTGAGDSSGVVISGS